MSEWNDDAGLLAAKLADAGLTDEDAAEWVGEVIRGATAAAEKRAEAAEKRADDLTAVVDRVRAELTSEDATAVLYGVTGTTPDTYGGVTTDEALHHAGALLTRLLALLPDDTKEAEGDSSHPSAYSTPVRHPGPASTCRVCPPDETKEADR